MDRLTCHIKEYIQPFERQLALQELQSLTDSPVVPVDGDYETALTFSIPKTSNIDALRGALAYWRSVGDDKDGLTIQLRSEATSLIARNGAPIEELPQIVRSLILSKLPNKRCLRYATHGMHEYRGKFFPQLVRALMNIAKLPEDAIILDPMCGSGTSLVEARLSGRKCYGLDINPLSTLVSNVKCEALMLRTSTLLKAYKTLQEYIDAPSHIGMEYVNRLSEHDREYLERWFAPETLTELDLVESAIRRLPSAPLRNFYYVCLSNILRSVSWQKNDDLRVRREITAPIAGETINRFLAEALRSTKNVVAFLAEHGPIDKQDHVVKKADARQASNVFKDLANKVNAVITSPPYATALPYIDTDRLSLIYLGLLSRTGHRTLDTMMIGNREVTMRGRAEYWAFYEAKKVLLPKQTQSQIEYIDQLNKNGSVGFRRRNLSALLSKYFFDMRETMQQIYTLLRPGGSMFLVVGNNRTVAGGKPVEIRTADHLGKIAESVGFQILSCLSMEMLVSRDIFRKNATLSEYIIRLEKPQ